VTDEVLAAVAVAASDGPVFAAAGALLVRGDDELFDGVGATSPRRCSCCADS
jgi:hypothetical protein